MPARVDLVPEQHFALPEIDQAVQGRSRFATFAVPRHTAVRRQTTALCNLALQSGGSAHPQGRMRTETNHRSAAAREGLQRPVAKKRGQRQREI